jgi:prolyl-tRNA synthetase
MKLSEIFGRTLRQGPKSVDPLTALAIRSAIYRILDDRIVFLPLGEMIIQRIKACFTTGWPSAQRVLMPPGKAKDDWSDLLEEEIQSYRQLARCLLASRHIQSIETPAGLGRPSWTQALQWVYAAASDEENTSFKRDWEADIQTAWSKMGLKPLQVEAYPKSLGWVHLSEYGSEELLICPSCGYQALHAFARFLRDEPRREPVEEMSQIETPGLDTIEALADHLQIPASQTLKAVFLQTSAAELVLAVLSGDLEVSLSKVAHAIGEKSLDPAQESVIRKAGAEPGYGGPVNLPVKTDDESGVVLVIGDHMVEAGTNFVSGANKSGLHLRGVNYPRDFSVTLFADIAEAKEGYRCPECSESLEAGRGILLAWRQQLNKAFQYNAEDGRAQFGYASMGTLLLEATMAALIDVHADEVGIGWPTSLAPFDVYLVALKSSDEEDAACDALNAAGLRVLLDDRKVSAGVKFTDADLIGCPLRVTVSKRSVQEGGAEISLRGGQNREIVAIPMLGEVARTRLESLM